MVKKKKKKKKHTQKTSVLLMWVFSGGSAVKNLSSRQETWIQSLGWEDPLEKEVATHSSILAWEIPQTEEPGGLQSMWSQRVRHYLMTKQQMLLM